MQLHCSGGRNFAFCNLAGSQIKKCRLANDLLSVCRVLHSSQAVWLMWNAEALFAWLGIPLVQILLEIVQLQHRHLAPVLQAAVQRSSTLAAVERGSAVRVAGHPPGADPAGRVPRTCQPLARRRGGGVLRAPHTSAVPGWLRSQQLAATCIEVFGISLSTSWLPHQGACMLRACKATA